MINLVLAFFNLVPIPPLDGSHVIAHAMPDEVIEQYRHFGQYGILALMGHHLPCSGCAETSVRPGLFPARDGGLVHTAVDLEA